MKKDTPTLKLEFHVTTDDLLKRVLSDSLTKDAIIYADSISEAWNIAGAIPTTFGPDEDWSGFQSFAPFDTEAEGSRVYLNLKDPA